MAASDEAVKARWTGIVILGIALGFFAMIAAGVMSPSEETRQEIAHAEVIKEAIKQGRSAEEIKKIQEILGKK